MTRLLLKHLGLGLIVVFAAISLTFVLVRLSGDPTSIILPQEATEEQRAALRTSLGLDLPILEQYFSYLAGAVTGDFGASYFDSASVSSIVLRYLPNTALLAAASFITTLLLAIPLGALAAIRRGGAIDRAVQFVSVFGNSIPTFWAAILLLQVFAAKLHWFPTYGTGSAAHLVLPTVTLALYLFPTIARLTRSSVIEILPAVYVKTARSKGLGEFRVVTVHVMRNALVPVVALSGLQLGALLGGAVLTETVFSWPGIGTLVINSISRSDFPVVQGIVAYVAMIFAVVTVLTEVVIRQINPRLR